MEPGDIVVDTLKSDTFGGLPEGSQALHGGKVVRVGEIVDIDGHPMVQVTDPSGNTVLVPAGDSASALTLDNNLQ